MFGRRNWRNDILIEGEKEAKLIARLEGYRDVNPDWYIYPLDLKLPERRTFWQAVKKAVEYSKHGIYNTFYKVTRKRKEAEESMEA